MLKTLNMKLAYDLNWFEFRLACDPAACEFDGEAFYPQRAGFATIALRIIFDKKSNNRFEFDAAPILLRIHAETI